MNVRPQAAIQGMNWAQIPGSAVFAAASPDGSLWALSTGPSGPDKYIWHYASGTWTNISGLATRLSVAPDGTLYAINSGGGAFTYSGGTWTALGGGSSDITAASDGSIYVLSNGNAAGSDQAIWHYNSSWTQSPGEGVRIAASWDQNSFTIPGGTVGANGLYIINSLGAIWYKNADNSYVQFPGSASAVAPTTIGGVFVLGYPVDSNGNTIYYYNLNTPSWIAQSGAGVSIATDSAHLYAIGSTGAIYVSPVTAFGNVVLSPTALNFLATGGAYAQTFSASETNYSGTLSQNNTCNPNSGTIATVSPASGSAPATFTVTPQSAGTCMVTISDNNGQSTPLTVTVTTTSGVIQ
jgi:hypothetical protein